MLSNNQVSESAMTVTDIKRAKAALEKELKIFKTHDGSRLKSLEKKETETRLELMRLERSIKQQEQGAALTAELYKTRYGR